MNQRNRLTATTSQQQRVSPEDTGLREPVLARGEEHLLVQSH